MPPLARRRFLHRCLALTAGVAAGGLVTACSGSGDSDVPAGGSSASSPPPDLGTVASDAFLAGFPLVTTVRTMQTFAQLIGLNRLFVTNGLTDPTSRLVVAPNHDTVYALAVLDLRPGPQVFSVPEIRQRYYVLQFLDAWMGGFGLVGTRATNGRGGSWAVAPPGYDGPIPGDVERLDCPTNQAFVLGRIRAVDDTDAAAAAAIGRQIQLQPLAALTGAAPPSQPPAMAPPVDTPQTVGTNGVAFFDELGDALVANPPVSHEQRTAIDAAAALGIGPSHHPSTDEATSHADLLPRAVSEGLAAIAEPTGVGVRNVNGWNVNLELGRSDTEQGLRERAVIARYFWGPVPAEEAVYPRATAGSDRQPLDGAKRYRIRFPGDDLPPVDGFWSVTVYGQDMFLVPNPANRYALSGDTPELAANADGSIDIYLQQSPPPGHETNWLPVPAGPFNLIMRLYLPRSPILDGTYDYPPITVLS
jgi:hypothetical protein